MTFSFFSNIFLDLFTGLLTLIFIGLTYIASVRNQKETYGDFEGLSALVVVPCRGLDYSLAENLTSIMAQEYRSYKTIAVVDSEDDPAVPTIKGVSMDYIISNASCKNCSGKVKAIATAYEKMPGFDLYVIADSDILVGGKWLLKLVSPFKEEKYDLSTTFPYFNPVGGFWSKVKLIWGFVGLGMMESKLTRFGWGGSLAFRRSLLNGDSLDFFKSFVSDDIALTKLCKKSGKSIAYVREAMPIVNSPDDFRTFIEWANRQTALSVYSTKNVLTYGLLFYGAGVLLFVSSILLSTLYSPIFLIFLLPTFINSARAVKRAGKWPLWSFMISLLIPFLYFYNLVKAGRMKSITWRGREYSLDN